MPKTITTIEFTPIGGGALRTWVLAGFNIVYHCIYRVFTYLYSIISLYKRKGVFTNNIGNIKSTQSGFTLAEVLITLGIIGIVSAITIPTLIKNYEKKTTGTRLHQAFSIFYNALKFAEIEHGDISTWNIEKVAPDAVAWRKEYLEKYLKISHYTKTYQKKHPYNFNGTDKLLYPLIYMLSEGVPCLSNGICFWMCYHPVYFYIIVDLNGPKNPNKIGHDIFYFNVNWRRDKLKGGLLSGYVYNININSTVNQIKSACNNTSTDYSNGRTCTELIIRNNWVVPDDYPW